MRKRSNRFTVDLSPFIDLLSTLPSFLKQHEGAPWKVHWEPPHNRRYRDPAEEAALSEERTLELKSVDRPLVVETENGSIRVTGEEREGIHAVALIEIWDRDPEEAQALMDRIEIATSGEGGVPGLFAHGPEDEDDWAVSFDLKVPHKTSLDLASQNGEMSIESVQGDLRFKAWNGRVDLKDLAGDLRGRAHNGRISLSLEGSTWQGAGVDIECLNGSITLGVPEPYNAQLDASTQNGRIFLGFPVPVAGNLGRRLRAQLGNGGPSLRAVTTNGSVRLERPAAGGDEGEAEA